ncbi:MAG: cyclic nucleotide-binding domain-containing protein [Bacteroidota bacterium]
MPSSLDLSPLKAFLRAIHPVSDEVLDLYLDAAKPLGVPRKTILTMEGEVQKDLLLVITGIQKSYFLREGKPHIMAFTYAPSFSGLPDSFFTQNPATYFLETITASQFLRIPYEQHQQFMAEYREIESLSRKATEGILVGFIQRHYELMALDIETRLRTFLKRSPHLLQQLSQKDLAAYLRIDPTNLSKLLNRVRLVE